MDIREYLGKATYSFNIIHEVEVDDIKFAVVTEGTPFGGESEPFVLYEKDGVIFNKYNDNMVCPSCKNNILEDGANALSRKDNETEICSNCGTMEALEEMNNDFLRGKK